MVDPNSLALVLRAAQLGIDPRQLGWQAELLQRLQQVFEEQGHPMTPWFALSWARDHSLPTPEWVLDYFVYRGKRINEAIRDTGDRSEAEAVGRALGFYAEGAGKTPPGAGADRDARDWRLAFELELERMQAERRGERFKRDAGLTAVAARNACSNSMVSRASDRYRDLAEAGARLLCAVFGDALQESPPFADSDQLAD